MKNDRFILLMSLFTSVAFMLGSCSKVQDTALPVSATALSSGVTATFSCSYFSQYDTQASCQSATGAVCSAVWQNFPSGGTGLCYLPAEGWESCLATPPTLIYTTYSWCSTSTLNVYQGARSVLGCSSSICTCNDVPALLTTCTLGTDCPAVVSAVPTPAPCP